MKSKELKCLWYCGALGVVSFVSLTLCTMMNGADVEMVAPELLVDDRVVDAAVVVGREAPVAAGSSLQRLSRKKRFVAFPEGSSFSVAFCLTIGFVGNPVYNYFSWSTNWGVAYDLPNETWVRNLGNLKRNPVPRPVVLRRQRRDLYERLEHAIDNMGYTGRQCILRALCESTQVFESRKKSNLAVEMVKTIFSLPRSKVMPYEHDDLRDYDAAHRRGRGQVDCAALFPRCTFSLIRFALGDYTKSNSLFK